MAKKKAASNPSTPAPAKGVSIPTAKRAIRGTDPKPAKGRRKKKVAYQALAYADAPGAKRVKTRKQRDKKLLKGASSNFRKAIFQGHIKALLSGKGTKATAAEISKYKNSSEYLKAGAEALKRLQGTRKEGKVAGDYKKLQEKYTKQAEAVLAKAIEKLKSKGMSDKDIKKSLSEGSDALASKASERMDRVNSGKSDRRKSSSNAGQSKNNVATQRKSGTKKKAVKKTPKKSSTKKVAPVEQAKGKQRAASSPKAKSATPKKTVKKAAPKKAAKKSPAKKVVKRTPVKKSK